MEAVVTLAGEGTRMLPWSRGLRKEFLPLYGRGQSGDLVLKSVAHFVVETLVRAGADRLTLVVQPRDLDFVRNYFSVDPEFVRRHRHHADRLRDTERFYDTLRTVHFDYAVQTEVKGFGDAVLRARPFVGRAPFFLHAGDAVLMEPEGPSVLRAMAALQSTESLDAVLLVRHVSDARRYGVVEGRPAGRFDGFRRLNVTGMIEKPERPKTHWAATAVYVFTPAIFPALERHRRTARPRELELTDGIRGLIADGGRVAALVLDPTREWRSVGSPEGFAKALHRTRLHAKRASSVPAGSSPGRQG